MNGLKAERIKMKHSPWWLLFLAVPIIPAYMGMINYVNHVEILKNGWYSLWTQETLFYTDLFFGPLIALCCAYQWRMEHKGKNWNQYLCMPISRGRLFGAKVFYALCVTVVMQLWIAVLFFLTGKAAGLPGSIPVEIGGWLLRGTVGGLTIACIQSFLAMKIKSFSVPIILALLGSVTGILISARSWAVCWPYCLMLIGMNSNQVKNRLAGSETAYYLSCVLFFLFFFCLAVRELKKKEC